MASEISNLGLMRPDSLRDILRHELSASVTSAIIIDELSASVLAWEAASPDIHAADITEYTALAVGLWRSHPETETPLKLASGDFFFEMRIFGEFLVLVAGTQWDALDASLSRLSATMGPALTSLSQIIAV